MRVELVRLCLSELSSNCCSSKTNTRETLLMKWNHHLLLHCNPRNLDLVLQLCLSQKYYSPCLFACCVTIFHGSAGRGTRAVVLHLPSVWGFSIAAEPFQTHYVHLPSRCCGGQQESFSDSRRYVNTPRKNLDSTPKQIQAPMRPQADSSCNNKTIENDWFITNGRI